MSIVKRLALLLVLGAFLVPGLGCGGSGGQGRNSTVPEKKGMGAGDNVPVEKPKTGDNQAKPTPN